MGKAEIQLQLPEEKLKPDEIATLRFTFNWLNNITM